MVAFARILTYFSLANLMETRWLMAVFPQVQFVLTMFQTSCAVVRPCGFPMGWLYFQISYCMTLILLFSNFYIQVNTFSFGITKAYNAVKVKPLEMFPFFAPQTYKRHAGSRKTDHPNGSINGHTNGVTSSEKVKYRKARADWQSCHWDQRSRRATCMCIILRAKAI